jgi:putative chitinase
MTKDKLLSIYKKNGKAAGICYDAVDAALTEFGINTPLTLLGALATVRTEVGMKFLPIREIASGKAYEGRKDLGNVQKGDGIKFKGRGYIQLTGRVNYTYYGKILKLDLVNNPDLALDVKNSARILALYFRDRKVNVACDKKQWTRVRKLVNGGTNGLTEFLEHVDVFSK